METATAKAVPAKLFQMAADKRIGAGHINTDRRARRAEEALIPLLFLYAARAFLVIPNKLPMKIQLPAQLTQNRLQLLEIRR